MSAKGTKEPACCQEKADSLCTGAKFNSTLPDYLLLPSQFITSASLPDNNNGTAYMKTRVLKAPCKHSYPSGGSQHVCEI